MNSDHHAQKRYREESDNWLKHLQDPKSRPIEEVFRTDTVDAWRHARMYSCIDPLLELYPNSEWLTVGDGHYGKDAHYILKKGHKVVASDISDALLKIGSQKGYIEEFKEANAEKLPFEDARFDFVLCKECLHHFPRPMVGLYEMLRVASEGVIIIEPNEGPALESPKFILKRIAKWILLRCGVSSALRTRDTSVIAGYNNAWEEVGNYGYAISEREMEKVALGMGYFACAFKGLNDFYEEGVEFEKATDDSPLFRKAKRHVAEADRRCAFGFNRRVYDLLAAVVFKQPIDSHGIETLERAGYVARQLPRNPYAIQDVRNREG